MISTFSQFIFLRSNHFDEESTSWKHLEKTSKKRLIFSWNSTNNWVYQVYLWPMPEFVKIGLPGTPKGWFPNSLKNLFGHCLGGQCPFRGFFRTLEPQTSIASFIGRKKYLQKYSKIARVCKVSVRFKSVCRITRTSSMTLERSSSWWSSDLALRDFKFKGKRGWRSNEHVRTGEAMNIDFLLMMKKNDGHSAGISVQQPFCFPIVHPMVPIGNLSTTVDQHLGEPESHRHRDVLQFIVDYSWGFF